jgi:hypothetical protein
VNDKEFERMLKNMESAVDKSWKFTGYTFRNITPKRTGNAKSKTNYDSRRINANYDYASKLDSGWSQKAPDGMSGPALDKFEADLNKRLRKI